MLSENPSDILSPMVLCFSDNSIMDLSDKSSYGDIEIMDVMKTMDNRHEMGTEMLEKYGL